MMGVRVKHQGGPLDGMVTTAAANVTEDTDTVSVFERCSPPKVHHYRLRRRGGRVQRTGCGALIYDYDITLPR